MKQHPSDAKHGVTLDNLMVTDTGYDAYVDKWARAKKPTTELLYQREITTSRPLDATERQELFARMKATVPAPGLHLCMIVDHTESNHLFLVSKE